MTEPFNIFDEYLKKYIPVSYQFSGIKKSELIQKVSDYKVRYEKLKEFENPEKTNYIPHCIFDLLVLSENDKEDKRYEQFLFHIDTIVKWLINKLDNVFHKNIKEMVRQMIISFDTEIGSNYQYLNFYGEILGLEFFISRNENFKLIDIERKLPNGKSVDFVFMHNEDKLPLYVDFVSYHNIKPDLLETEQEFIDFFENRFNKKLECKSINLKSEDNRLIIDNEKIPFMIQPIIWAEIDLFIKHREIIKKMDNKYANVSTFASLFLQRNKEGKIFYNFTSVSNIIDRIIEEDNIN